MAKSGLFGILPALAYNVADSSSNDVDPATGQSKPTVFDTFAKEAGHGVGTAIVLVAIIGIGYLVFVNETRKRFI